MYEQELKEKARRLIFKSDLRDFPVVFEMYVRTFFQHGINVDEAMAEIVTIIRTSQDSDTAYTLVCHYLDALEE